MSVKNVNLLWKNFRGIRKLNTINSDQELGADIAHGIRLSKEKSGQLRSIRSSGWFAPFFVCGSTTITQTVGNSLSDLDVKGMKFAQEANVSGSGTVVFTFDGDKWVNSDNEEVVLINYGISYTGNPIATDEITITYAYENVIRLFVANFSGYGAETLVAFTKDDDAQKINVWIIYDSTYNSVQIKIAEFPWSSSGQDVTDACMVQWGDRLGMVVAFGGQFLGFVYYSADATIGGTQMGSTGFYYRTINLQTQIQGSYKIDKVTSVCPYKSRLAINGETNYVSSTNEAIYGIWFSEAGNLLNFNADPITSASETSAFYVEVGERVNKLEEYHGLTAFCNNRSYNVTGTSQEDITVMPLTAKGVFGNAAFTINGKCAYIDSYSKNIFTLRDNIDGTIGFDDPVGDDIQDYLYDITNVSINSIGRRVRIINERTGQSLIYDVDVGEWTEEQYADGTRAVTFLDQEFICFGGQYVCTLLDKWQFGAYCFPDDNGYYSHYRTNLMWLDSQSSVKSHLYPFAIILEPQTNNDFYVKFTTDRGESIQAKVTKGSFENVATYSNSDSIIDGGFFVSDDEDLSGKVFFGVQGTELLVTVEKPPFWRYLQIDIYTTSMEQQFNISGIEAKNTMVTDEMLEY